MSKGICAQNNVGVSFPARLKRNGLRSSIIFFSYSSLLFSLFLFVLPAWAGESPALSTDADKTTALPIAQPYGKTTTPIVISVTVNTVAKGDLFVELDDEGKLFIKTDDLGALNLKFDGNSAVLIHDERYVPAGSVLDVTAAFDEKKLALSFIGKTTEAQQTIAEIFQLHARPQNVYYPRETSAFLNYGLSYGYTSPLGFKSFSATNKLGARTGDIFFVSDSLYSRTETDSKFVRLQTSATYERRGELEWLTVGDQFSRSGELGGSVNLGGIGFSKVYKLDPYFITQPIFDLQGSVIYPTQAEIFLDGILVGRQQIAPGTFDLKNIYSYAGSHRVEVVLKDPFGQERRIAYPVYFNTFMLRSGLHEYSYNVGFLREQYGFESNEYGKPVFSAFHRYGLTNSLNIGAHAEGSDGVYNGGLSTSFLLARIGAFTFSLAASDANGVKGSAGSFQHTYQRGSFNTNIRAREFSRNYATVSAPARSGQGQVKQEASAGAGFLLTPVGSLSLNYSALENHDGERMRSVSANFSRTLSRMISLFATVSETRQPEKVSSFFVGLNFNFDSHIHGSAQYTKTGEVSTQTAQLQKDVPVGEGLGYRATMNRIDNGSVTSSSVNPFVQYNGPYGIYSLDMNAHTSAGTEQQTYALSASGALVYAGGFYGLARPVSDSFSIVMLDKIANAKVLNNGQEIGTTGSSGKLVVPTLTSYGQNQITVDVKNLPMDYSISGVNKALSPSLWSGSCVAFDALKMQAVTGSLFAQKDGKKMPMEYVEISVNAGGKELTFPTGKNGEFYIENTIPKEMAEGIDQQSCTAIAERRKTGGKVIGPGVYPASIVLDGQKCMFQVTFPRTEDVITDLGEIQCAPHNVQTRQIPVILQAQKPEPAVPVSVQQPPQPAEKPGISEQNAPDSGAMVVRLDRNGRYAGKKDRQVVAALSRQLKKNPDLYVMIEVHFSEYGSEHASKRLAAKKTDFIRKHLITAGVKPDRIRTAESWGKGAILLRLLHADADAAGRDKTRSEKIE